MSTSEAEALRRTVERLKWDEICHRYPDRWVVLVNIDWVNDTDFDFRGAEIVAMFGQRKDASPTMKALIASDREAGCFWTGEIRGPLPRFIP